MDQRMDILRNRIGVGGHKRSGSGGSHLMLIHQNLGEPLMVGHMVDRSGLREIEHEPVPVVVMAGIRVVQPGHGAAFETSIHIFLVPVRDHGLSVRIHRRDQDQDDIL